MKINIGGARETLQQAIQRRMAPSATQAQVLRTAAAPPPSGAPTTPSVPSVSTSIRAAAALVRQSTPGLRVAGAQPGWAATIPGTTAIARPPPSAALQAEAALAASPATVPYPTPTEPTAMLSPFPTIVPSTPASARTESDLQAARDETAAMMERVGQAESPAAPAKPGIGGPLAAGVAGFLVAGPLGAAVGAGAAFMLRKKG